MLVNPSFTLGMFPESLKKIAWWFAIFEGDDMSFVSSYRQISTLPVTGNDIFTNQLYSTQSPFLSILDRVI